MTAKLRTFRANLLPSVTHSEITKIVLSGSGNQSEDIRNSILAYAEKFGFVENGETKPDYLNQEQWQIYLKSQSESKRVNYNYYLAYLYLKSLEQFRLASSGRLIRLAVENHQD
jgi:hypothetical protein